jgi:hypothetical protein
MILTGENRRTGRKTCPTATLSATNLTWTGVGSNVGLCDETPETYRLSHGMVYPSCFLFPFPVFCKTENI